MKLRYTATFEDIVAAQYDFAMKSFTGWPLPRLWWLPLLPAALFVAMDVIFFISIDEVDPVTTLLNTLIMLPTVGMFVAMAVLMKYPRLMLRLLLPKKPHQMYHNWDISGVIGPHELELTDDALFLRNRLVESRMRHGSLYRVDAGDGYTFVHTKLLVSFVIPHAKVTAGDPAAFAAALKQKLADTSPATG